LDLSSQCFFVSTGELTQTSFFAKTAVVCKICRFVFQEHKMPTIEETIRQKLSEIEQKYNVKIIYACESGSRAWGFASPDSDYDVRFVYVRDLRDYLKLEGIRDVIEYELNDIYDINGWDIKKLLLLLAKSNPVIFEWADSPVVYRTTGDWERVKSIMPEYFSEKRMLYHYISIAKNNLRAYFKEESVILKKYLYVLRPIFACCWILDKKSPPPTLFSKLYADSLPVEIEDDFMRLLEAKKHNLEKTEGPHIKTLDDFIQQNIAKIEEILQTKEENYPSNWDSLNKVFLENLL